MSVCRTIFTVGLLGCACYLSGCGSQSLLTNAVSNSGNLLAVKVADYTGADALSAKADVVTEQSGTVSLPVELTQDTVDAAVIALTPADIVVALAGAAAKVPGVIAKGKPSHAGVVFRLAGFQDDACMSDITVGPFELTIEDGTVTVDPAELPIPSEALGLFRDGQLALCVETQADFDGTISLGKVAVETGRLHGGEARVTICHMPLGEENDAHTITVGSSAVDAHLAHGDELGECDESHDEGDDSNPEDQSDLEEGEDESSDEMDDDVPNDGEQTCTVFTVDGAVEFSDFANPKRVGVDTFVAGVDTVIIGFDVTTDGDPLVAGTLINSVFQAVGVRLAAVLTNGPHAGEFTDTQALDSGQAPNLLSQVGISPPNILSGVDPDLGPQFSGGVAGLATLIVTFVTPSGDPAKVSQVGAFNDLIFGNNTLTAYAGPDASGRVLGTVSATGPGDFFGLGSSAGIASVTFSGYSTEIDDLTFTPVFVDCNDNGVSDRCDVANGTSQDNDDDGIPDECDGSDNNAADSDNDGVTDSLDQCPNTPNGQTVDAAGCSCSQKDADADDVDDCTDTCAATGAGLSVDANGCASNQLDDDGDGVMNDADVCANTATGTTVDASGCTVAACSATIITIEPPAGQDAAYATAVNNLGQVVGWYGTTAAPFLWDNGLTTDLGTLGGVWGFAYDINDAGDVSMKSKIPRGQNHAAIWSGGTITDLQLPGQCSGCNGDMRDTNLAGVSVGWSEWTSPTHRLEGTVWYPDGTYAFVTPIGYTSAVVQAINDAGDIIMIADNGIVGTIGLHSVGFLLSADGTLTDLGTPGTQPYLRPEAMSVAGIVGKAFGGGPDSGFLWSAGVMTDLGEFIPTDINAAGDMVGASGGVAYIMQGGVATDMNTLLPPGSGWTLTIANGINDFGRVVGSGTIGGVTRGFVMDLCKKETIHETATLGNVPHGAGLAIGSSQFIGSRFHIDATVQVTAVGGHVGSSGTIFARSYRWGLSLVCPQGTHWTATRYWPQPSSTRVLMTTFVHLFRSLSLPETMRLSLAPASSVPLGRDTCHKTACHSRAMRL